MIQEMLSSFAATRGYKAMENKMVGVYRGYPFVSRLKERNISVLTTVITTSSMFPNKLGRRLRKQLPAKCALTWNGPVTLTCSGRDEELFEAFTAAMDTVTAAMAEAGMGVQDKCAFCGKDGCDCLTIADTKYVPVHSTCCQERSYATATKAEMNERHGNYITGLIGAILGGIVATLPSLATIWFMERIYSILFILIPLGIYYGYKLLRGRMNKFVGVVTVLLSLIMPFVLEQMVFYLSVATTYGIVPNILATTDWYFELFTVGEMVEELAMPYVFLIFGLIVTFKQITRTFDHEVADASTVLESMMPWRSYSATDL